MKSKLPYSEYPIGMMISIEDAIAIKELMEREYISRESPAGYEAIMKIIRFANEQLANRVS